MTSRLKIKSPMDHPVGGRRVVAPGFYNYFWHYAWQDEKTAPDGARFDVVDLGFEPELIKLRKVRDVLFNTNHIFTMVPDRCSPVRLDRNAFVDHDGLQFAHHFATRIYIRQRVCFRQQRIELFIGKARFVPCNT